MSRTLNDDFNLDEILEEYKNKNMVKNQQSDNGNNNVRFDISEKSNEKIHNEKFNINIDFNDDNFFIDESLLYDEELQEDNVVRNLFKTKEELDKDNIYDESIEEKDLDEHKEEKIKLNENEIFKILRRNKKLLIRQTILLVISFMLSFGSIWMSLDHNYNFKSINILAIVNLIAIVISVLSCSNIIIEGLISLFKRGNGSYYSIIALMCFVVIIQSSVGLINIQINKLNGLYAPSVILILLFDILGKWKLHNTMKIKSRFMSYYNDISSISYCNFRHLLNPSENQMSCFSKQCNNGSFHNLCFSQLNYGEKIKKLYIFAILLMCTLVSVISFFVSYDFYCVISSLCCMLIISCPLSTCFCFRSIINKISKNLYKNQMLLYKYSAIDKIKDCDNLIIDNDSLFDKSSFKLIKMKVFDYQQINDSIINISSLLIESDSLLSEVFFNVIGHQKKLIRKVKNIEQDNGLGLSGIIEGKKVILGTSDYLLDNNVVIHSKYINLSSQIVNDKSLKVIYVAIDGLLTAMFLIKISPLDRVKDVLTKLAKHDLKITLCLKDAFISSENVSYVYNFNENYIEEISCDDKNNIAASDLGIFYSGPISNFVSAITECIKIKHLFNIGYILQVISLIVTSVLVITFVCLNSINHITFSGLILIQIFWFVIMFLVSNVRR